LNITTSAKNKRQALSPRIRKFRIVVNNQKSGKKQKNKNKNVSAEMVYPPPSYCEPTLTYDRGT